MPCSDKHFIPILDELEQRAKDAEAVAALRKRRGGPRPGSGAPEGNLNALKHGRFSRRHKILLETILARSQRPVKPSSASRSGTAQRQAQAELEAAYLLMRWLATHNPEFLPQALDQAAANLGQSPLFPSAGDGSSAAPSGAPPTPLSPGGDGAGAGDTGEGSPLAEGVRARNNQTQNNQLSEALADMNEAFERKFSRKTTRKRTPKPRINQTEDPS